MKTRTRAIVVALAVMLSPSAGMAGFATAGGTPKITIKYNGSGFEGKIKNVKPRCLKDRKVTVHKKNGQRVYTDTTEDDGSWNTGNSGQVTGRYYAKARATDRCARLVSRTIRAVN